MNTDNTFDDRDRLKQRLKSFDGWTSQKQYIGLAAAGFRYTGQLDRVKCDYCNKKVVQWTVDDDPIEVHIRFSPTCVFLKNLGYTPEQRVARYPKYSLSSDRLLSMEQVPSQYHSTLPSFESIADSGFFYQGTLDRMMCYTCGLILKDWEATTDPFGIHKRFRPECFFVQCLDVRRAGFDPPLNRGQDNDILLSMRELSLTSTIGRTLMVTYNRINANSTEEVSNDSSRVDLPDSSRALLGNSLANSSEASNGGLTNLTSSDNELSNVDTANNGALSSNPSYDGASSSNPSNNGALSTNHSNNHSSDNGASNSVLSKINTPNTEAPLPSNRESEGINTVNTNHYPDIQRSYTESTNVGSLNAVLRSADTANGAGETSDNHQSRGAERPDQHLIPASCGMESTRRNEVVFDTVDIGNDRNNRDNRDDGDDGDNQDNGDNGDNDEIDSGRENSDEDMFGSPRTSSSNFHGIDEVDSSNNLGGNSSNVHDAYTDDQDNSTEQQTREKRTKIPKHDVGGATPKMQNNVPVKQAKDHLTHSNDASNFKNRKKKIKPSVSDPSDVHSKSLDAEAENIGPELADNLSSKSPKKRNIKLSGNFGNIPKVNNKSVLKTSSDTSSSKKKEGGATAANPVNQSSQGQGLSDLPNCDLTEHSDFQQFGNIQGATSSNTYQTVPQSLPAPRSQISNLPHGQQFQSLPPVYDSENFEALPMVQAVMDFGVPMDRIIDAVNVRYNETGEMFPDAASLLSTIFDSM